MTKPERIPLFPLPVVLLPATPLPLHIFEPRYKTMIRRCLHEGIEFGLILATEKGLATVGCTAKIMQTLKEYPDGRSDVLTEGRSVFRLVQLIEENEYHEGHVEYLVDASNHLDKEQEGALVLVFGQCHVLLYNETWSDLPVNEPATLSYRMAGRLPMGNEEKQRLLEIREESKRREFLLQWVTQLLPVLATRQRVRHSASGNGHALN